MRLGRARRAAAAVAPGTPAQQHHDVAGHGGFAAHMALRSRAHDHADFHALGGVALVIDFVHQPGGQADLVAIAAVAGRRGGGQLPLREFAGNGLLHGPPRVCRAGDAHGLVNVGAAGEGIADGPADAGRGAAEGLDFGGMVVRFVFEQQKPGLGLAVDGGGNPDGAGVDFFRFVQIVQHAAAAQRPGADGGDIHERHGLADVQLAPQGQIAVVGRLGGGVVKARFGDVRQERGVAAVVGPVSVQHAQLGQRRIAAFPSEIVLAERQIVHIHRQRIPGQQAGQLLPVQAEKAFQRGHALGPVVDRFQRRGNFQRRFAAFDGVDDIALDRFHVPGAGARQQVHLRRAHDGPFALREQLHALRGGIGALVKLPGQRFDGEHRPVPGRQLARHAVQRRFGENRRDGARQHLRVDMLHVIALQKPQSGQAFDADKGAQILQERCGLQIFLFFHIDSVYHRHASCARRPISLR